MPVQISTGCSADIIRAGAYSDATNRWSVWTWGDNSFGQLGNSSMSTVHRRFVS